MDEEFILVSKQKIKDYETKIKELESQKQMNNSSVDKDFFESFTQNLHSSIDSKLNVVTSSFQGLDSSNQELKQILLDSKEFDRQKYEEIIQNLKLLVEHLEETSHLRDMLDSVHEIKSLVAKNKSSEIVSNEKDSESELNQIQILEKLQEIELFMSNLRILLSYVKPKNLERER